MSSRNSRVSSKAKKGRARDEEAKKASKSGTKRETSKSGDKHKTARTERPKKKGRVAGAGKVTKRIVTSRKTETESAEKGALLKRTMLLKRYSELDAVALMYRPEEFVEPQTGEYISRDAVEKIFLSFNEFLNSASAKSDLPEEKDLWSEFYRSNKDIKEYPLSIARLVLMSFGMREFWGIDHGQKMGPIEHCEIFRPRCISCGKAIGKAAQFVLDQIKSGASMKETLDRVGLNTTCCRTNYVCPPTYAGHTELYSLTMPEFEHVSDQSAASDYNFPWHLVPNWAIAAREARIEQLRRENIVIPVCTLEDYANMKKAYVAPSKTTGSVSYYISHLVPVDN